MKTNNKQIKKENGIIINYLFVTFNYGKIKKKLGGFFELFIP